MIAPSSYHRLLFRQPHKEHMLFTSNKLLIIGMVFLALVDLHVRVPGRRLRDQHPVGARR